ncbi:hypothetical protein FOL47_008609 [Perkinsus chesapeaki]|uniref:Lipoprotein signal peptidase n=1 Tax=Perkinsus chesapeaki TaxID=330153 RepID=A0A7J6MVD7_PERCH|nr:hypothetical protein FOL47_008609 [Perkinsus chesapeaki]
MSSCEESNLRRRAEGPGDSGQAPAPEDANGPSEVDHGHSNEDTVGFGYPLKWWTIGGLFLAIEFSLKYLANRFRPSGSILSIFSSVLEFDVCYVENRHSALSFARGINRTLYWAMMSVSILLLTGAFVYFFIKKDANWRNKLGIFIFMVGAVGNGLDRLLVGAVVDYVSISGEDPIFGRHYYLAWNLSDLVINAAFGTLVYQGYLSERATARENAAAEKKENAEKE